MTLTIKYNIPETESYEITCCDQVKTIDSLSKEVKFDIEKAGNYRISVKQLEAKMPPKSVYIPVYIITGPLVGIGTLLFFHNEASWEENIRAWLLNSYFNIDITGDTEITLTVVNSEYKSSKFSAPALSTEPESTVYYENIPNKKDIPRKFKNFLWVLYSGFSLAVVLFVIMMIKFIETANTAGTVFSASVLALLAAAAIYTVFWNYKKMKRLIEEFEKTLN